MSLRSHLQSTFLTKRDEDIEAACKKKDINKILRSTNKYSAILSDPSKESLVQSFDAIFKHQPRKAEGIRTRCLKLSAEVESAVGNILEAAIKKLEESNKHMSDSCVSFSAGSDKEPLGNDADFMKGINTDKLHKAVTKAAIRRCWNSNCCCTQELMAHASSSIFVYRHG